MRDILSQKDRRRAAPLSCSENILPLSWGVRAARSFKRALGKINRLMAFGTFVGFVEFVRKNFNFLPAFRTVTCKRGEIFESFKTWTMLWCCLLRHGILLCVDIGKNNWPVRSSQRV
jgi:hypothetical protein